MGATGYRIAAARGLTIFERVADDLFSPDGVRAEERDAAADRALIREHVRRVHRQSVRRQRLVSRRS